MRYLSPMVARLNGSEIEKRFSFYQGLVREGIAGFIVFGGELEKVRAGIRRLQGDAEKPLIIASDLEQGLGQQVRGGTLFPPAQAVAEAASRKPGFESKVFGHIAAEAAYAGINVIFAPVLDIDSNPENPIISTRSFGQRPEVVAGMGAAMIRAFTARGIRSCGKHFPGHGDTSIDSHIGLPRFDAPMERLREFELKPFQAGIMAGASMMMLAHMIVPAIDSLPVSVSAKTVRLLREEMGFNGIITTDAMDMGALKHIGEAEAARMCLEAEVDIILHPSDPKGLAHALERMNAPIDTERLDGFRALLSPDTDSSMPVDGESLARESARLAVRIEGNVPKLYSPVVVAISDDGPKGMVFAEALGARLVMLEPERMPDIPEGDIVLAVFSSIRAYKGGKAGWLDGAVRELAPKARLAVAFGPPALLKEAHCPRVYAWWVNELAEKAAAEAILKA